MSFLNVKAKICVIVNVAVLYKGRQQGEATSGVQGAAPPSGVQSAAPWSWCLEI